ncbi:MAG: tRNA (adenosine(37)-N6)-threonylcarbamoyltransferase complex transferase subunit TsaD [Candidatus Moranbacteria bacterium]|nr:tRNA (adenosine(37)-N6)-threonylcarbamoyltransferase complex transferase subunit TsaD [Candidatus Moranbacteria bacterium]
MHSETSPTILAIETSCDDTAAAVISLEDGRPVVRSSVVSSQIELHRQYGGVVPNLAAREHVRNLVPVIDEAMRRAGLGPDDIDAIAVTQGPGLIPALLAGVSAAKSLALAWRKPLLGIHHIEGHIYANFIGEPATDNSQLTTGKNESLPSQARDSLSEREKRNQETEDRNPSSSAGGEARPADAGLSEGRRDDGPFPLLALVVSGGHTELVLMRDHFTYEILGRTKDDAAGEAFDKVAKMLGLPYPGGPEIAARAAQYQKQDPSVRDGFVEAIQGSESSGSPRSRGLELAMTDKKDFHFPRPMIDSGDYDFSFSGLKTAVLYQIRKVAETERSEAFIAAICHAFQEAVVEVLVTKTRRAIREFAPRTLVIAGGVSANVALRESLADMVASGFPHTDFIVPEFKYSLDNAAMIGAAALLRFDRLSSEERGAAKRNAITLEPDANLPLSA